MLMDKYQNQKENKTSTEFIYICKYQISLLSYYLLLSFDTINSALEQCERMLKEISKNKEKFKNENSTSGNSDSLSTEDKSEDILDSFKEIYGKKNRKIGKYHWKVRAMKILKYKLKQIIRQGKVPILTKYSGRSKVASQKPRCHGRFVKISK
jgi:hypothetical protein